MIRTPLDDRTYTRKEVFYCMNMRSSKTNRVCLDLFSKKIQKSSKLPLQFHLLTCIINAPVKQEFTEVEDVTLRINIESLGLTCCFHLLDECLFVIYTKLLTIFSVHEKWFSRLREGNDV